MKPPCFIVLDCGATNVRAMALTQQGQIIARASVANASEPAQENPQWQQWPFERIMQRLATCCREVVSALEGHAIAGLTVTTFGVDGALVDARGKLLYPVISWKCPRTLAVMQRLEAVISQRERQTLSGVGAFSFNTLYKLCWLAQHQPRVFEQAHAWLFISSLINQRLTGAFTTDLTMAGTGELLEIARGEFSEDILTRCALPAHLFPPVVRPGERVGQLQPQAAQALGLPAGLPVIATGHDTQFALFGSGAGHNQPVLSSGTWEILMVRSQQVDTGLLASTPGSTCELDSAAGLFNPGMQYLASGVLEWVRGLFWTAQTPWPEIIAEAGDVTAGCDGLRMGGQLLNGAGWQGATLNTTRGHFMRAALEHLTSTLADNLRQLERIGGFHARELLLVGGGSRNTLWNQMKADALGIPVKVLDDAETTVLGAALYGWWGTGYAASAEAAREQVQYRYRTFSPRR